MNIIENLDCKINIHDMSKRECLYDLVKSTLCNSNIINKTHDDSQDILLYALRVYNNLVKNGVIIEDKPISDTRCSNEAINSTKAYSAPYSLEEIEDIKARFGNDLCKKVCEDIVDFTVKITESKIQALIASVPVDNV